MEKKPKSYLRLFILLGFVLALSTALLAYISSSFLSGFVGEKNIGFIFLLVHGLALLAILKYTSFINKVKIFKATFLVLCLVFVSLLGVSLTKGDVLPIFSFVLYGASLTLVWISLDIYIEYFTRDQVTGRIRGIYSTLLHVAWFIAPPLTGNLLKGVKFSFLYLLSAFLVLVVLFIFYFKFRKLKVDHFPKPHFLKAIREIVKNKLLNGVFVVAFLLQAFYATMVIFAPIYLHNHMGFGWDQIGWMFFAMLSTFLFLTYPAGWLADKYLGEKEMMSIGLFILGVCAILFGLVRSPNFWIFLVILFFSRVGASLVEIMRDTYFFKRVDVKDIHIISLFRTTTPLAFIFVSLISIFVFRFLPFWYIFVITGSLVLLGLSFSLRIKDTK